MVLQVFAYIFIGLAIFWVILNLFWFLILGIKKYTNIKLPQEIEFHVRKTIRINLIYLVVFAVLGYLFI
jgi:hypothetical protein